MNSGRWSVRHHDIAKDYLVRAAALHLHLGRVCQHYPHLHLCTCGWFARALWSALDPYWSNDKLLPEDRQAVEYKP